jgi:hypothetical protein
MRDWVDKSFNSEWRVDWSRTFDVANKAAVAQGMPPLERKTFVMTEQSIPLEKRYRYALECYAHRGARPAVMAKTALMGAWALRAFLNVPIGHQALDGGYEEVNDKLRRNIREGEVFQLAKWLPIYKKIFDDGNLTNEGTMVAGLAYFGLQLREGDLPKLTYGGASQGVASCKTLDDLSEQFQKMDEGRTKPLLLGIVHERKRQLKNYLDFLSLATDNFIRAIAEEEFTRDDLVTSKVLVVAEGLRRTGRTAQAMDWYLALSQLPETQPKLRDEIRAQGKAPSADATKEVQVGWLADQRLAQMAAGGEVHSKEISGQDRPLLNAIVVDGLGRTDYVNPNWKPAIGGSSEDCRLFLALIGKAVLDYRFRLGSWPVALDELWEHSIIRDRNRVNRFHDPVTGEAFLYEAPKDGIELENMPLKTVMLATAKPIDTNQGAVYFAFLANTEVVWAAHPLKPGDQFQK